MKQVGCLCVYLPEAADMEDHQFQEQEVQIARFNFLAREVTDPLAVCLLRVIVEELEADLRRDRDIVQSGFEFGSRR
jgi:hypothetical protein